MDTRILTPALLVQSNFKISPVDKPHIAALAVAVSPVTVPPNLGPLVAFAGSYSGEGLNTIFRPESRSHPRPCPVR